MRDCITPRLERLGPAYASHCGTEFDSALKGGGIEEPTLAGLLNRLQHDGWIERRESPNDRRCKTIHLHRGSKPVLEKIFNTAHDLRAELIEELPVAAVLIFRFWLSRREATQGRGTGSRRTAFADATRKSRQRLH